MYIRDGGYPMYIREGGTRCTLCSVEGSLSQVHPSRSTGGKLTHIWPGKRPVWGTLTTGHREPVGGGEWGAKIRPLPKSSRLSPLWEGGL